MADIEDIQNGEVGSSVKDKLNDTIAEANKLRDLDAKRLVGNKTSGAADATNDIELKEVVELATATHENVPTTKAVHDLFDSLEIPEGASITLVDDDNFVNPRSDTASSSQAIKAYVDAQVSIFNKLTQDDFKKFSTRPLGSTSSFYRCTFYISKSNNLMCAGYGNGYNFNGESHEYLYNYVRAIIPLKAGEYVNEYYTGGHGAPAIYVLTNLGNLYSSGYNGHGALGHGNTTTRQTFKQIAGISNVVKFAVSIGDENAMHCVAVKTDGTLWTWGYNGQGQLGLGHSTNKTSPTKVTGGSITGSTIIDCFATSNNGSTYVIDSNRNVHSCGYNGYGQLGLGNTTNRNTFNLVSGGIKADNIVVTDATSKNSVYIIDGTDLYSCGYNGYGQLGLGNTTNRNTFNLVPGVSVDQMDVGGQSATSVIVKQTDGTVKVWGYNNYGQLGTGDTSERTSPVTPTLLVGISDVTKVAIHGAHNYSAVLRSNGEILTCGYNGHGNLGIGNSNNKNTFKYVLKATDVKFKDIALFGYNTGYNLIAVDEDDQLWGCGYATQGSLGNGDTSNDRNTVLQPLRNK